MVHLRKVVDDGVRNKSGRHGDGDGREVDGVGEGC